MRVGILTFPNSISYGATLQMYALYHTVKKLGHEVEVINYYNAYMKAEKHISSAKNRTAKHFIKKQISRITHKSLYYRFRKFESKNLLLYPAKYFVKKAKLTELGKRYDAVICGSDQVWNPDITDSDLSYFLDFCGETTKRISYAPSFGVEELSEDLFHLAESELNKFSAISVREQSGQALVEKMTGKSMPIVIDPTMLVDRENWELIEDGQSTRKDDYILYYTVKGSKSLFEKCRRFAQRSGMRMVVVGGNLARKLKNRDPHIEYAIDISPQEWLSLVDHARYIVTNSFHGTAFSIIFEKDFYLELSAITNSRLTNIVDMLGLNDRVVPLDAEIIPSKADYSFAKEALKKLRENSIEYLENALSWEHDNG